MRLVLLAFPLMVAAVATMAGPARAQSPVPAAIANHTVLWNNGDSFTGAFRDGLPNGAGVFRGANGKEVRGDWHNGCLVRGAGSRMAILTRLSDCPSAPPAHARRPHADFFR